ncbi:MAG: hypothetical protein DHS20C17_22790 [Cyclobacteriaceae bacterium]|nr:MAG: hypothetical protein DHS20C17_22790 [Cyclobacteriaceae bacterium]
MKTTIDQKAPSKWVGAGFLAAIAASLCCVTPVLALVSGASGIAATFSWLEPVRPFLIGLTVLILGVAWYLKLKPTKTAVDCVCDDEKQPFIQSKIFLGIVTVLAVTILSFPSYSHIFYQHTNQFSIANGADSGIRQLRIDIKGMTCAACEEHVKYAASQLEGVLQVDATFETGTANIRYHQFVVSQDEVVAAVKKTGYKVTNIEEVPID